MQVHITGRQVHITEAIREHVYEKIERSFHGLSQIHEVNVILDLEKRDYVAELVVTGKDHIHLEAEESSDNLFKSIDQAIEKIERQLRKMREKLQSHH